MIKILVDSASDIDKQEAEEFKVELLPIEVKIGDEEYLDGVTLSHKEFYEKLIETDEFPLSSQINAFRFEEKFNELTSDGSEVLVITLSSKLSGTYNNAMQASKKFKEKVYVVDSLNASLGERILFLYAYKLVNEGKLNIKEIVNELNNKKTKIQVLALLDTLKYLKKGGRISSLVAFTGEMFSIKPVISVVKGEIKLVGKAIGSKKGNNLLSQLINKCGGIDFNMPYTLAYSGLSDNLLQKYLIDSKHLYESVTNDIPYYLIGSTIGTHIGPGAIGVAFFQNI